jgi:23S rRNA-/tRNA-specific pseudouridylate synthase
MIVEEYPPIPSNGLDMLWMATTTEVGNDPNIKNYCQRLNVTGTNLTIPIALMILDLDRFPSLSKARKACRQGKILWKVDTTISSSLSSSSSSSSPSFFDKHNQQQQQKRNLSSSQLRTALVGDRFHIDGDPKPILVRRETRQVLERQTTSIDHNSITNATTQEMSPSHYQVPSLVRPPFHLSVVYEDDFMAIVDKPAGVLTYPEGGKGRNNILFALPYFLQYPTFQTNVATIQHQQQHHHYHHDDEVLETPVPVHRLDFATSGLLVVAKTKHASRYLAEQFEFRQTHKTYTALVYGTPQIVDSILLSCPSSLSSSSYQGSNNVERRMGMIQPCNSSTVKTFDDSWNLAECLLDGKRATTWWRIMNSYEYCLYDNVAGIINSVPLSISRMELKPVTGRYHQLRRQLSYLYNTPIVGDPIYAKDYIEHITLSNVTTTTTIHRYHRGLMLCCNAIEISHPFYNTLEGRNVWKDRSANQSSIDQSCLFEDSNGNVIVKASVTVPQKFDKFCLAMERITHHVSSLCKGEKTDCE